MLSLLWKELKYRQDITAAFMPQDYSTALDFNKTPVQYLAENYTKEEVTRARTYMGGMKFTTEEMTNKTGELERWAKSKDIVSYYGAAKGRCIVA